MTDLDTHIDALDQKIRDLKAQVAAARRQRPREAVTNYAFEASGGQVAHLQDLFAGRSELILVHNMGRACAHCTMWADGLNGVLDYLLDRSAFVLTSPDSPEAQHEFRRQRGWRFKMVSVRNNSFPADMGFETADGPMPGVSVFSFEGDGPIYRVARAEFCPGDDFCPVWPLLDLLTLGADGWEPTSRLAG